LENDNPTTTRILCAVRGGSPSQRTIDWAVEFAKERGGRLIFVYVVDAEFLGYATVGRPSVVLRELRATGEFTMNLLTRRLAEQGVEADAIVRTGDVQRQIIECIRWQDADVLIVGQPVTSPGRNTFTSKSLNTFVGDVRAKTGIDVVVVENPATSTAVAPGS
jgi:nucleotide-binding universal stress UspA family protein